MRPSTQKEKETIVINQLEAIESLWGLYSDDNTEIDERIDTLINLDDYQASMLDGYQIVNDLQSWADFDPSEESAFDSRYIDKDIPTSDRSWGMAYNYDVGMSDPYVLELFGNAKLARQYRFDKLIEHLESIETMQDLNSCMSQINECLDKAKQRVGLKANRYWPLNKGDLGKLRGVYLDCRDKMPVGCDINAYYTVGGDNPIIHDQAWTWDHEHESEGGWSRLDPTSEEDFRQRNELDIKDMKLVRQAEIKTTIYKGKIVQANGVVTDEQRESAEVRRDRYERLRDFILHLTDPSKVLNARSVINKRYFDSVNKCTKTNDFSDLYLREDQQRALNILCIEYRRGLLISIKPNKER